MTNQITVPVNDRIQLTEIRTSDKAAFVKFLNEKDIYDRTLRIPHPYSAEDAENFVDFVNAESAKHGYPIHFAIRTVTEELIGGCAFNEFVCGHRAEIAYWLAKPYWGQGIMTDVVKAACELAIAEWKLVRITAHVFDSNAASARVLEKAGFKLECLLRKHHKKDGKLIDAKLYSLVV